MALLSTGEKHIPILISTTFGKSLNCNILSKILNENYDEKTIGKISRMASNLNRNMKITLQSNLPKNLKFILIEKLIRQT